MFVHTPTRESLYCTSWAKSDITKLWLHFKNKCTYFRSPILNKYIFMSLMFYTVCSWCSSICKIDKHWGKESLGLIIEASNQMYLEKATTSFVAQQMKLRCADAQVFTLGVHIESTCHCSIAWKAFPHLPPDHHFIVDYDSDDQHRCSLPTK